MERSNRSNFIIHEDPIYFQEAVISMAQRSGFLSSMIETELKPVLRDKDFKQFEFELVYSLVENVARNISEN